MYIDKESSNVTYNGIGFTGLLTIVFIVLKLTGVIAWSWFWVLSPIIISVGIFILLIVLLLFLAVIIGD